MKSKLLKQTLKSKKGFTLVEMMVVVVIIAGLAGLVLSNAGPKGPKGKAVANYAKLVAFQDAANQFINDYGQLPSEWGSPGTTTLTAAQKQVLVESCMGTYATSGALATFSATNATMNINEASSLVASRFEAVITPIGGGPRVVVLQYRSEDAGPIVNGDKTISTSFLGSASTVSSPNPYTTITAWTTAGKAAWPY